MRYFFAVWLLLIVLGVGILGFRDQVSKKPPIEVFPDMDRQNKLRPQTPNSFFADGRASRLPVPGTIARETPLALDASGTNRVFTYEDNAVNTGMMKGSTNFVEGNPFSITAQFLARGQERYGISCAPCHGPLGDGNGVTKKLGMAAVKDLHGEAIVKMTDGEIFHVITHGRATMGPYGPTVDIADRWAIVAYLRALQTTRLGTVDDVPEQMRASLTK